MREINRGTKYKPVALFGLLGKFIYLVVKNTFSQFPAFAAGYAVRQRLVADKMYLGIHSLLL